MNPSYSILIASAETKIRELFRTALEKENFECIFCGDGEEAMESAKSCKEGTLRCLVLDLFLPKVDGFEMVRQTEETESLKKVPVLMLLESRKKPLRKMSNILLRADDYLEKPFTKEEVKAKVHSLTKYFRAHAAPHPVTQLPGHPQIEQELFSRLNHGETLTTLWLDINHFRPFNDHYGRNRGDEVLQMTVQMMEQELQTIKGNDGQRSFLAHVDGDDFILLFPSGFSGETFRDKLRSKFQTEVMRFYSTQERKQKFFYERGRDEKEQIFPLMTLSAVILNIGKENFTHYGELVSKANDLLHQAKLGAQEVSPAP